MPLSCMLHAVVLLQHCMQFRVYCKSALITSFSLFRHNSQILSRSFASRMILTDFDANLLHTDLVADRLRLVEGARKQNVKVFVVPGSTIADSIDSMALSKSDNSVLSTCGVHPYHTEKVECTEENKQILENLVKDEKCLCVGECGLDYSEGFPDRSFQLPWFEHQLSLAIQYEKPLYFHFRAAHADTISTLSKFNFRSDNTVVPAVVHCFTGNFEELQEFVSLGFYIGLTGYILNLSSEELKRYLDLITLDKLVIETDAPYMGFKGCRKFEEKKKGQKYPNVPSALVMVAEHIASVGGWSVEEVAEKTTRNAHRFLRVQLPSI